MVLSVTFLCLFSGLALAASAEGPKGWLPTDTYRVMNFSVLFIALFLLLRKPVSKALNGRIDGIKQQLVDLETKKAEAEKQLETYKVKLAELDQEADRIVDEYIKQGNEAKAKIIAAAESTAVKLEEQAKRNIESEFKQAKIRLQEEVLEKALVKAEELLKDKITSDDQDRLVDEYLDKVVA
jgi:F-type H+-transporting ATPase subunit b